MANWSAVVEGERRRGEANGLRPCVWRKWTSSHFQRKFFRLSLGRMMDDESGSVSDLGRGEGSWAATATAGEGRALAAGGGRRLAEGLTFDATVRMTFFFCLIAALAESNLT